MSVIALDFYSPDDPNGTPLGGLDEADCKSIEFRVALTELGSGLFTVSRHNAQASSTLIREDNLVKVRIPSVSADPIFAFWLKEGDFTLISNNEQGGEDLTFGGPGVLHILSRARLHHTTYAPDQPNRGDAPDVPFMWRWRNEPYGAMLVRGIEEGQNEPGEPLADVTINFDRFQDSNSQPWPEIVEDFQTPIGTDILTLAERVATGGDLYLIGRPDLEVRAYQEYGRDLTGAFASDNVRFEKGVNILTELKREIAARDMLTHVIVQDSDGDYGIHTWSGYSAGDRATYGFLEVGQTNDPDQVDKIAQATLDASRTSGEQVSLEITPGFDPTNGRYMPGPSGTDGHFWIGDTVTVHTGSGEHDFNAATQRVVAIRVVLHEAAVDDTDDTAARSFHVVPELNYLEIRGFSGVRPSAVGQPGFCCGPGAPVPPDGAACTRWYMTDTGISNVTKDAGWDGESGSYTTEQLTRTPTGTVNGQKTWDAVNAAAGDYIVRQYQIVLNTAEAAALAAGGTFHMQARGRSRYGLGVSESEQDNYHVAGLRVYRSGVGIVGTALAVGAAVGGTKFPAQATLVNRGLSGTLSAVAGAQAGDIALLEIGTHHVGPTTGATGSAFYATDTSTDDLPVDEATTNANNSWFEFCTTSAGGDAPITTVRQGQGSYGTPGTYVPTGSTVEAGLLSSDGAHYFNASDIEYDPTDSGLGVNDVQQAIDALAADSGGGVGTQLDEVFLYFVHRDNAGDYQMYLLAGTDGENFDTVLGPEPQFTPITTGAEARDGGLLRWRNSIFGLHTGGTAGSGNERFTVYEWADGLDEAPTFVASPGFSASISGVTAVWAPKFFRDPEQSIDTRPYVLFVGADGGSVGSPSSFAPYYVQATADDLSTYSAATAITGTGFPAESIDPWIAYIPEMGTAGSPYKLFLVDDGAAKTVGVWESASPFSGYVVLDSDLAWSATDHEAPVVIDMGDGRWRGYYNKHSGFTSLGAFYRDWTPDGGWGSEGEVSTPWLEAHGTVLRLADRFEPVATSGASALDDLTDVTVSSPAEDEQLQYISGTWVNSSRRWEPVVTDPGTGPELVFDGSGDIVMTWVEY